MKPTTEQKKNRAVALNALTSGKYKQTTCGAMKFEDRYCARAAMSDAVYGIHFSSSNLIIDGWGLTLYQAFHARSRIDHYNDKKKEAFPEIAKRLAKYFRDCDRYNAERES